MFNETSLIHHHKVSVHSDWSVMHDKKHGILPIVIVLVEVLLDYLVCW